MRERLRQAPQWAFLLWATTAAFCTYFCMYGLRKPFAVGTYELDGVLGLDLKTVYVLSQLAGYATSKFLGIKVVSEMTPARRGMAILVIMGLAELALVGFAATPAPYNAVWLVLNGLPLGMVWGLVFSFLEGRRSSDLLGAGLCASFIVASGFVKAAGKYLLDFGVPEMWMPATTGAVFLGPMLFFVWMLVQVPPPTAADEAERTRRAPMDGPARTALLKAHAPALLALTGGYVLLSAYRDFRDNFAREIWDALGYADTPSILATAELPVAIGSVAAVGLMFFFKNNRYAIAAVHGLLVLGMLLVAGSTGLYQLGFLGPAPWMILVGLGLYVAYVPFNCVLFDRLIAALGWVGTAGFLIYFVDTFGYAGSVLLLLYKNLGQPDLSWLSFFLAFSWVTSIVSTVLYLGAAAYFWSATDDRALAPQSSA